MRTCCSRPTRGLTPSTPRHTRESPAQPALKNERGRDFDLRAEYTALHNRLSVATAKARSIVEKEALACEYAKKLKNKIARGA